MAIVAVVLIAAGTVVLLLVHRSAPSAASGGTATLEGAGDLGPDPFLNRAQVAPIPVLPDTVRLAAARGRKDMAADQAIGTFTVSGLTGGLYGGTAGSDTVRPSGQLGSTSATAGLEPYEGGGELAMCDVGAIADFLESHPNQGSAWAGVTRIATSAIRQYLTELTPVILLSDTVVTNHGFRDGAATTLTSVLQAGTAVLIDSAGMPVTRCACGNPLSAPPPTNLPGSILKGTRWSGFDPHQTVTVTPGQAATSIDLVAIGTAQRFLRPIGAPPSTATRTTTSTPASTNPATHPSTAVSSSGTSPSTTTAGPDPWRSADWDRVFRAVECPSSTLPRTEGDTPIVTFQDVTGDGIPDALLVGRCPTTMGSLPSRVLIFDGAEHQTRTPLAELKGDFRTLRLSATSTTITAVGQSYGVGGCCPAVLTMVWTRSGSTFVETAHSTAALPESEGFVTGTKNIICSGTNVRVTCQILAYNFTPPFACPVSPALEATVSGVSSSISDVAVTCVGASETLDISEPTVTNGNSFSPRWLHVVVRTQVCGTPRAQAYRSPV